MNDEYEWMEEAREYATAVWLQSSFPEYDVPSEVHDGIIEATAQIIANWMQTAAQNQRNTDYYRGLVEQCGEAIGPQAYVCDDGTTAEDVLCAKVPELVERLVKEGKVK